jgi:hypothetical protein
MCHETLHVLTPDEGQMLAEFPAVEIEQPRAVARFLFRHLVEHPGGRRKVLAQPLGNIAVDAAVLILIADGEGQYFLFGQVGKSLHGGPPDDRTDIYGGALGTRFTNSHDRKC